MVVAPFLVRLPGRGLTAAVILAVVTIACAVVTRRATPSELTASATTDPDRPRAQHLVALCVVPAVIAVACLPFLFNEHTGVLGEGIYTNDQAAQLYWTDWLADGFGPQPNAVSVGYPVGPQALAASVSEGTTVNLVDAFNGLLLAIPALTALAALSLLGGLPPWRRGLAAGLTGLPYLGASFLAQSGFKETVMALLVVALAVVLHLALRRKDEDREAPPARAVVGVIARARRGIRLHVLDPRRRVVRRRDPGLGDPRGRLRHGRRSTSTRIGGGRGEHRSLLIGGAIALVALARSPSARRATSSTRSTTSRAPAAASPRRCSRARRSGSGPRATSASSAARWTARSWRRPSPGSARWARPWRWSAGGNGRSSPSWAPPSSSTRSRARSRRSTSRPRRSASWRPLAMLVTVRWLLAPGTGSGAAVFARPRARCSARWRSLSTLLALRAAPVGFDDRGADDLRALAERIDGDSVVFLGVDRFAGYWLRGTLAESPGGYVPQDVEARPEKTWQQGLAMDFDTLSPSKLDRYDFAITTAAAYASTPPPNFDEVAREGDYVLWERTGRRPPSRVLEEGGEPGVVLECRRRSQATAAWRPCSPTPVTVDQGDWEPAARSSPARRASSSTLPPGDSALSLQYHSQVAAHRLGGRRGGRRAAAVARGLLPHRRRAGRLLARGRARHGRRPGRDRDRGREPSALQARSASTRTGLARHGGADQPGRAEPSSGRRACGEYVDHLRQEPISD